MDTAPLVPTPQKEEYDASSALTAVYPIVDSIFDILSTLNGKVDWDIIEKNVEEVSEEAKLFSQNSSSSEIDTSPLIKAIRKGNASEASNEAYRVLLSLMGTFKQLSSKTPDPSQTNLNFVAAKTILNAYYVLNDVIFAIVVGDPTAKEETNQLETMLNVYSNTTNVRLDTKVLVDQLSKVQDEMGNQQRIEECRALFKNQVKLVLDQLDIPQ